MLLHGIEIVMDVESYLLGHGIVCTRRVGDEFFAQCPFHESVLGYESNPTAWSINTETGVHNCFSCGSHGSIVSLIKLLDHHDTMDEAERWLVDLYGVYTRFTVDQSLELDFGDPEPIYTGVPEMVLDNYCYRHPYLSKRGIDDTWQSVFGIGYDRSTMSITIPWRFEDGTLATVKKRSVTNKRFWYDPPVPSGAKKRLLWGMYKIVGNIASIKKLAIVESETDCMYVYNVLWQKYGVASVAIGGSSPSHEQMDMILRYVPADVEIIIMTDNDSAGITAAQKLVEGLSVGGYSISMLDWSLHPTSVDVNSVSPQELERLFDKRLDATGLLVGSILQQFSERYVQAVT